MNLLVKNDGFLVGNEFLWANFWSPTRNLAKLRSKNAKGWAFYGVTNCKPHSTQRGACYDMNLDLKWRFFLGIRELLKMSSWWCSLFPPRPTQLSLHFIKAVLSLFFSVVGCISQLYSWDFNCTRRSNLLPAGRQGVVYVIWSPALIPCWPSITHFTHCSLICDYIWRRVSSCFVIPLTF